MSRYHPDWLFNLILKFAVVVSLSTLALSLTAGVGPLTALLRSGAAFITFAGLAWAASLVWEEINIEPHAEPETEVMTDQPKAPSPGGATTRRSTVEQPTQPVIRLNPQSQASSTRTTGDLPDDTPSTQPATVSAVASRNE